MSIPEQLKQAYEQQAVTLNPSTEPDDKLLDQFVRLTAHQQRRRFRQQRIRASTVSSWQRAWKRPLFLKLAIGFTVLALVSGFADYIWIRIGDGRVNIQYSEGIHRAMDASMLSSLHAELQQVRSKLAPGESAVVYSSKFSKLVPEMTDIPLISVSNPIMIDELDAWKSILDQEVGKGYKLPQPQMLDFPLIFVGGKRGGVYGPDMTSSDVKLLQELKAEAETSAQARASEQSKTTSGRPVDQFAWRVRNEQQAADSPIRSYTARYNDAQHNVIDVTLQLVKEQVEMRLIASGAEQTVEVNGSKGVYLRSEPFIFSETNQYQTIQWLETQDNVTIIYSVGSESIGVTKQQLLAVAASMSE